MSQFAEVRNKHPDNEPNQYEGNGVTHFNDVSTPSYIVHFYGKHEIKLRTNFSVSSTPVVMRLCSNNKNNIFVPSKLVLTLKREKHLQCYLLLLIRLANQLMQPSKLITLNFAESGLAEGHLARKMPAECTI